MKGAVFLGAAALATVACASPTAVRSQKVSTRVVGGDDSYDLFVFCLRWPETVCSTTSKSCTIPSTVQDFTIHGLWPNYANTPSGPAYCNPSSWDPSKLDPIRDRLNAEWTDFEEPGTTEFWEHEWKKHGSCAGSEVPQLSTELEYFNATLNLRDGPKFDIVSLLAADGITPSWSKTLYPDDVIGAFKKQGLGIPLITCTEEERGNAMLLRWVEVCLNKGFDIIDCPEGLQSSEKSKGCFTDSGFLWPPIGEGQ